MQGRLARHPVGLNLPWLIVQVYPASRLMYRPLMSDSAISTLGSCGLKAGFVRPPPPDRPTGSHCGFLFCTVQPVLDQARQPKIDMITRRPSHTNPDFLLHYSALVTYDRHHLSGLRHLAVRLVPRRLGKPVPAERYPAAVRSCRTGWEGPIGLHGLCQCCLATSIGRAGPLRAA